MATGAMRVELEEKSREENEERRNEAREGALGVKAMDGGEARGGAGAAALPAEPATFDSAVESPPRPLPLDSKTPIPIMSAAPLRS